MDNTEIKKDNSSINEDLLSFLKDLKNIVVRKQSYEDAAAIRELEKLLVVDEKDLKEAIFRQIFQKATQIYNKHMEKVKTQKPLNFSETSHHISRWLKFYAEKSKMNGYVIGVSGGIDSAVCSTLCAMTGLPLTVIRMSIHQAPDQADRGTKHIEWLKANFSNVKSLDIDLTESYDREIESMHKAGAFEGVSQEQIDLACGNTRSRLRMVTLYGVGGAHKLLVCGTGNKVEDYGIGFFTKFGDGGVDLSPIGELTKTEVYALAAEMRIIQEILDARPTDGLWTDGRTDEDQIGATYPELEWAMEFCDKQKEMTLNFFIATGEKAMFDDVLTDRQLEIVDIYWKRHQANTHKMSMPPICELSKLREE
jgi:NAD+ synthase